jgi:ribose transport system permease protein
MDEPLAKVGAAASDGPPSGAHLTDLEVVLASSERSRWSAFVRSQEFWIIIAIAIIACAVAAVEPTFRTSNNLSNVLQNFCFVALMAIGMTPIIISGGIDISIGSTLGLCGISLGLVYSLGAPFLVGVAVAIGVGALVGLANGVMIAYLKLPSFIVTLGMMSLVRSQALVVSNNRVVYDFGPATDTILALGGGTTLSMPNVLWAVVIEALLMQFALSMTRWGRYVRAIGGNQDAARLTGIPVDRIKLSVYVLMGVITGVTAIFLVGWLGAVTNAFGQGQDLPVVAAAVIGGANLLGGFGTAAGAIIGSILMEVIRNSLLLLGANPYWQGTFVGGFILFAVLLERMRSGRM